MAYLYSLQRILIALSLSLILLQAEHAWAACSAMDCVTGNLKSDPQPTLDQAVSNATGHVNSNETSINNGANNNLVYFIVSLVIQSEFASNGNQYLSIKQIKELYNVGITPQQMYTLTAVAGYTDETSFFSATCDVFWCSLASPPPPPKKPAEIIEYTTSSHNITNSVTQDIISTGNTPTQLSVPMSVCSFLVNNQNVCTETNVTTATAIISVAVLGGIIAAVTTAVNNEANNREQQIKYNNDLLTLLALQNQTSSKKVCYDSAVPPNIIPCP